MGRFLGVTNRLLAQFIHADRLGDQTLTDGVKAMALRVGREGFIRQKAAIIGRPGSRRDLAGIVFPILVLCGGQDLLTPVARH